MKRQLHQNDMVNIFVPDLNETMQWEERTGKKLMARYIPFLAINCVNYFFRKVPFKWVTLQVIGHIYQEKSPHCLIALLI